MSELQIRLMIVFGLAGLSLFGAVATSDFVTGPPIPDVPEIREMRRVCEANSLAQGLGRSVYKPACDCVVKEVVAFARAHPGERLTEETVARVWGPCFEAQGARWGSS